MAKKNKRAGRRPPKDAIRAGYKARAGDSAGRNIQPPEPDWCYGCHKPKADCGHT